MIFYFSGTGNSRQVAIYLAERLNHQAIDIAQEMNGKDGPLEYLVEEEALVGLVFPVHAWGPPQIMLDFISQLNLSGRHPYIFSLATCASEAGRPDWIINKVGKKRNIFVSQSFALIMPNNFMLGRGLDSKEIEQRKLEEASKRLDELVFQLSHRKRAQEKNIFYPLLGLIALVINPLFRKFALDPKHFYVTQGCTQCGVCLRACPMKSISLNEGPIWSKPCTMCFSCINRCPEGVIQFGKRSIGQGRYVHPDERVPKKTG